jgi:phosphatidylglycerol:prolipoprotein diacylglycerol transferase
MMVNNHWVDNLSPFVFQFSNGFGLRYYGLAYLLAFLAGYAILCHLRRRGRSPLTQEQELDALFALIVGVFAGGRIGYMLLYGWHELMANPLSLFEIWKGGMSSHGGFIGVALACAWISWRMRIRFLCLSDILCVMVPPGLFLVRIANFINGELWGKISNVSWAVIFPRSVAAGVPLDAIPPRHPSQLYEALLEGVILFLYTQWRCRKTKALKRPGQLSGEFLILYALCRIFGEQFREPDAALIMGLSRGVFYSVFLLLAGAVILWTAVRWSSSEEASQKDLR